MSKILDEYKIWMKPGNAKGGVSTEPGDGVADPGSDQDLGAPPGDRLGPRAQRESWWKGSGWK